MKTNDLIYRHLFGMKAKRLAGMEKNYMEQQKRVRKQIGTNKHKFRPQKEKEKNTQELTRIKVKNKQSILMRLLGKGIRVICVICGVLNQKSRRVASEPLRVGA